MQLVCWLGTCGCLTCAHAALPPCPCSLTFFFALNALSNYDPYQRWRIRLESVARRLGIADDLTSPDQWEGEG